METTRPRLEDEKAADGLKAVLEDSGYIKMWENDKITVTNDNATLGGYDFNYVSRVFQCGSLEKEKNMNHLKTFRQFIKEEDGMGTVEVILIIVVLVGLVVIFKEKITEIVNSIFSKITSQTKKI